MKKFIIAFMIVAFAASGMFLQAGESCCKKDGAKVAVFKSYIAAHEALAADNFDGAKKALAGMVGKCKDDCQKDLGTVKDAKDIKALRLVFKAISTKVASCGDFPKDYASAFCPMAFNNKGAFWVQKKGTIANPYYGAKMLTCGKFKEMKVAKKDGHAHDHGKADGHGHKH